MIDAETFWSLPRSTKPRVLLEEILPEIPALAGVFSIDVPSSVHVLGSGGGEWSVLIVDGRAVVTPGVADQVITRVSFSRRHLREVVGGALHERGLKLMERLGKPRAFPDLSVFPIDPSRVQAVAATSGSIAIEVHDRDMRESYRFVISFGSGPPVYDTATTTVHVDVDEVLEQISSGASIASLLKGTRARLEGDISLPLKVLHAAFGADETERGRASR